MALKEQRDFYIKLADSIIDLLPSAESQIEKAFRLFVEWAEECDFGYDNIPEEYEKYKDDIKDLDYVEGLVYIAMREVEHESN